MVTVRTTQIFAWVKWFPDGREYVADKTSVPLTTSRTEADVEKVTEMAMNACRLKITEELNMNREKQIDFDPKFEQRRVC
jgi:hypothetical protein